jgi:peptidoglycan DL-endopeptidase LytE
MRGRWISILSLAVLFIFGFSNSALADQKYKVKAGDNLARISKKFKVSVADLKAANGLQSNDLKLKQVLVIPGKKTKQASKSSKKGIAQESTARPRPEISADTETYIVKKGDTARSIARDNGITLAEFKRMNHLKGKAYLKKGRKVFIPKKETEEDVADIDPADDIPEKISPDTPSVALGKWKDPDERSLFIKVVKSFLGVPYKLGGNTVRGIDCSAFVKKVYEIFDVSLPRTAREQSLIGKKIDRDSLQEGDLVFFKTRRDHVGIYVGNNQFVHLSYNSRQAKVDNLDSQYFSNRFLRGVRVKELGVVPINQAKNELPQAVKNR